MPVRGFDILELLGSGASGDVFRARQLAAGGRVVALKRVRPSAGPEAAARARREAAILASLDHPHVVRVFEVVADEGTVAIAMQLAEGGSLADLLARRGRLSPGEVVALALPVAEALASAQRRGVLHGDVKPANILLTSDGEPLLADFGIALAPAGPEDGPASGRAAVHGTPGYLDPAVAAGARPDSRSDVYSLGAVCHEALTGWTPGDEAAARGGATLDPGRVPAGLLDVLRRSLARLPDHRFPTATAMAASLRALDRARPSPVGPALAAKAPVAPVGPALAAKAPVAPSPLGAVPRPTPLGPAGGAAGPSGPAPRAAPTRRLAPRPNRPWPPPASAIPAARRRPAVPVAAGALALAALAAVCGLLLVGVPASAGGRAGPPGAAEPPAGRAGVPRACAGAKSPPPAESAAGAPRLVDTGDGCLAAVVVAGNVVERQRADGRWARVALGGPGDVAVVGDWDCDGRATPGLWQPGSGSGVLFAGWAEPGGPAPPVTGTITGRTGAQASVRHEGGCDRLELG